MTLTGKPDSAETFASATYLPVHFAMRKFDFRPNYKAVNHHCSSYVTLSCYFSIADELKGKGVVGITCSRSIS